ncbi:MAG: PEP-CTERM sorting domain-containing protein [Pontiellaceae bacterium]|nr:PEP-CTERM sorting domain-containing protein [Pontiellaceae bacterium]MBN2784454.1 PEP-CTERM sorting domain-containing protein [Pontiellaceae bacterium]
MRFLKVLLLVPLLVSTGFGTIVEQIGSYNNWVQDADWTPLTALNDAQDGMAYGEEDFVGDALDPAFYWADNGSYLFFRMRVYTATADIDTFNGTHTILIDLDNYLYGTGFGTDSASSQIDFALTWDSKNAPEEHGFEMSVAGVNATTWSKTKLDDIDGITTKGDNDINGAGRTTDGYIRSVDGQATANFGDTTFVDFAISWNYLTNYTDLAPGQTWDIAAATIENAQDHAFLTGDIAGGASPASALSSGWTTVEAIPEPATLVLIAIAGCGGLAVRRLFL